MKWLREELSVLMLLIAVSLIISSIFALCLDVPLVAVMYRGWSLLSEYNKLARIVIGAIPLWLAGLAFALPLQVRYFNIGADGQLSLGAFTAAMLSTLLPATLPDSGLMGMVVAIMLALCAGLIGALWATFPLLLKRNFGLSEVIATLLLNVIAFGVIGSILRGLPGLADWTGSRQGLQTVPFSASLLSHVRIYRWGGSVLTIYGVVALLVLCSSHIVVWRTHFGLRLRAVGESQGVAQLAGILPAVATSQAVVIGGALAGLAGLNQIFSVGRFDAAQLEGLGYQGIAVAILGRQRGGGILLTGIFFSWWHNLSNDLQQTGLQAELFWMGQGLAILSFLWFRRRNND